MAATSLPATPSTESHKTPTPALERRRRIEALRGPSEEPEKLEEPENPAEEDPAVEAEPEIIHDPEAPKPVKPKPVLRQEEKPTPSIQDWFAGNKRHEITLLSQDLETVLYPVVLQIGPEEFTFILSPKEASIKPVPLKEYRFHCSGKTYEVICVHRGVTLPSPVPYTLFSFVPIEKPVEKPELT